MEQLRFCSIGFGYSVCVNKVYMLLNPKTNQARRMVKEAKADGRYIDATCRRALKTLILMDDGKIIACVFAPRTTLARLIAACEDTNGNIIPAKDFPDDEDNIGLNRYADNYADEDNESDEFDDDELDDEEVLEDAENEEFEE